jgi:hypothetical protein
MAKLGIADAKPLTATQRRKLKALRRKGLEVLGRNQIRTST